MINPVQPVGPKSAVEKARLDGAERRPAADAQVHHVAEPPPAAVPPVSPAAVVQFSSGVVTRQESAARKNEWRGRPIDSAAAAEAEAAAVRDDLRHAAHLAARAQANTAADRVFELLA
jgi:hypothetical protein